jgi:hypothetical protein
LYHVLVLLFGLLRVGAGVPGDSDSPKEQWQKIILTFLPMLSFCRRALEFGANETQTLATGYFSKIVGAVFNDPVVVEESNGRPYTRSSAGWFLDAAGLSLGSDSTDIARYLEDLLGSLGRSRYKVTEKNHKKRGGMGGGV